MAADLISFFNGIQNVALSNTQTSGMGFGIITNSVAEMALYSYMDQKECEKQLRQKENVIRSANNHLITNL